MPAEVALISEGTATRFTNMSFIIVMFVNVTCKFPFRGKLLVAYVTSECPFLYLPSDMAL